MIRSLRNRLIFSHILPILVTIPLAAIALFFVLETQFLLPSIAENLSQDARYLAELSRTEFQLFGNPVIVSNMLNRVEIDPAIRVMFLDKNGRLLFSSDSSDTDQFGKVLQTDGLSQATEGEEVVLTNYSIFRLRDVLVDVFSPVTTPQEDVIGVVRVSYRSAALYQFLSRLRNLITVVLIIGLLVGTTLGSILGLNIGNPIRQVTSAIYGVAQGERDEILPEEGPDEIRELSRSVNYLVERLEELEAARRHLLANLVHELGRPLGAMRSGIQSILRGADRDPQLLIELTKGMDEEADGMQHVLEELAHLHDEVIGTLELNKEELVLNDWLPKVLLPWKQAAGGKQIHWTEEYPTGTLHISADPIRMGQVIGNLASNAVKYTPGGGSVSVSVDTAEEQVWIKFVDTGSGIAKEEQELVFEPFYRGDQGRKIKQGMGLGLSIARDILHAHGGEIE
ncbi:MAG: HAMP domain-containing histidine kinase, partial [Chloroflexi bacterium]|nr:HAMP domain-containing histidine kinase [Chloroflexota bacterium]